MSVVVTMDAYVEDGRLIAGIDLTGKINMPPRAWVAAIREELGKLERVARDHGCVELRVAGRDWSRILPDYERMTDAPEVRNGLRKALA